MDSLALLIDDMAVLAEKTPGMLDTTIIRFRQEVEPLIRALDKKWTETLIVLTKERMAITEVLREERAAAMVDLDNTSKALADKTFEYLRSMVSQVLLFVIIILVVLLGFPFTMGFLVGKYLRRKS